MILPVYAFGSSVLRKTAVDIAPDYHGLSDLIADMFETMKAADGVGLAAPQVGHSIRLFVMDARVYSENEPSLAKIALIDRHHNNGKITLGLASGFGFNRRRKR